ncbi:MAG TPA: DNA primase [Acidimicrobiales bacterium]|nr:DNA primase [Acidimicrobiales bacterium]
MGILAEDIARVRDATDFVAVASERMSLKQVGTRWTGLCPFHAEKTPSFSINAEQKLFHCFGCQVSGDVITFVRETEHLDFAGAVEKLASKAGIQLRYDDNSANAGQERKRRDALYAAMDKAVAWYHERLMSGNDAGAARGYLRERGYDKGIVEQFKIGWAPDEWDALAKHLRLDDKDLADTGLGFVNKARKQQDFFRGRVMFPIYDPTGRAVAFGGRVLPGSPDPAKYKNSSETPIYSKRRILYGLNWAKADAVTSGEVVVCEGYTDVIAFYLAGAPRAVATCGTAVTDEHLRVLRTFAPRIVLAYDADAAGQAAAARFYEWERDLDLSLHVLALPKGADPADLARRDPEALKQALKKAKSFLDFRVQRALDAGDLRSPEGRAKTAEHALEMVAEHPNELTRNQYVGIISGHVDIPPEQLMRSVQRRGDKVSVTAVTPRPVAARVGGPETEALKVAIHHPEAVAGKLHEVLFGDPAHRDAFLAIASGGLLTDAIGQAPPDAAALLSRLAVEDVDGEPADVLGGLVRVAADAAAARLNKAVANGADFAALSPTIGWLKQTREQLQDDELRSEATVALVAWLAQEAEGEGEGGQ